MDDQGRIAEVAQLVSAIGGLAWPAIALAAIYLARERLPELLGALVDKVQNSTELKFGAVELKGPLVDLGGDVLKDSNGEVQVLTASKTDVDNRRALYANLNGLVLVHTVRPVRPREYVDGREVFDVSLYIHAHSGKLNDIRSVTYFLGDHFGKSKYGSKWKVASANHQFALSVQAYGTFLCVAEIEFQNSETETTYRYIDTEMLPVYGSSVGRSEVVSA